MGADRIDVLAVKFGQPCRISDSDSRLIAYGLDGDGDEAMHLEVRCAMVAPDDELATIKAVIDLCNGRAEIITALRSAEKLLDGAAFVSTEGDTKRPLRLIRAALAIAEGGAA